PTIEPSEDKGEGELAYVATFEVVPDFGDLDMSKLSVVRHTAEVTEEDIDRMIDNLRQQRRSWSKVTRPAQAGDAVEVETWTGLGAGRIPAEGVGRGSTVIGSGGMFRELEDALAGMEPGSGKQVELTFPADWRVAALAGRMATVHVKAVQVSEPHLPEVDAAFIRSFGVRSGELDQFRAD